MERRTVAPLAAALVLLAGCAAAPPPRDDIECRVIPTGMVECQPRQAGGASAPGGR